jgi:hypothetical protein
VALCENKAEEISMKKKLALAFILALAGSAFLFAAGTSAILSPRPAAPAAKSAVLKAGETVSLSYRQKGKNRTALTIRV